MDKPIELHGQNLICIGIDRAVKPDYAGRLWHQYSPEPIGFSTTMEMIEAMDELYDRWNFPQRSTVVRRFGHEDHRVLADEEEEGTGMNESYLKGRAGDIGTFIVRVKYRQNATWQGEVVWAEKQKRQNFRSALELLKLMDGALEEADGGGNGADDGRDEADGGGNEADGSRDGADGASEVLEVQAGY